MFIFDAVTSPPQLMHRRTHRWLVPLALALGACGDPASGPTTSAAPIWREVVTSYEATCALDEAGAVACARGFSPPRILPVASEAALRFTALSTNQSSGTCGLTTDGAVRCWTAGDTLASPPLPSGHRFTAIGGGPHGGCALDTDGGAWCWRAANGAQDLGRVSVSPVTGAPPLARLTYGEQFGCGLDAGGAAYCWPTRLYSTAPPAPAAAAVPTTLRFASISAGGDHICALDAGGAAYCWGDGSQQQLGVSRDQAPVGCTITQTTSGPQLFCDVPQRAAASLTFRQIVASNDRTCASTAEGAVYCWGMNQGLALGVELPQDQPTCRVGASYPCTWEPVRAGGGSAPPLARLAATSRGLHECGLTADGRGFCWGRVTHTGVPDLGNSFYGGLTVLVPLPDR
jgi:hypothetical protein